MSIAFDKYDKILILTANAPWRFMREVEGTSEDETLKPQKETLLRQCGFNVDDRRFMTLSNA